MIYMLFYIDILNKLTLMESACNLKDSKESLLLHMEYPTKERYNRKHLQQGIPKGSRGHFDLSIWNPEKTNQRIIRVKQSTDFQTEQQTMIAIEIDLLEHSDSLEEANHHLKWDLLKLKSAKNEVEFPYCLIFSRHWIHRDRFLKQLTIEIKEEPAVAIIFADKPRNNLEGTSGMLSQKPFLQYDKYHFYSASSLLSRSSGTLAQSRFTNDFSVFFNSVFVNRNSDKRTSEALLGK